MAENDPNVMYAYIIRSSNKGLPVVLRTFNLMEDDPTKIVWEELELPVQNWISAIVPDTEDPSRYWISYNMYNQGNKIFYFNGEEHVNHSEELGYTEIRSMEIDRETNRLYLGTSYGLMTRGAQDDKWTLLNGLPGVTVRSMDVNYAKNKLVIGTFGRGVWQCNLIR